MAESTFNYRFIIDCVNLACIMNDRRKIDKISKLQQDNNIQFTIAREESNYMITLQ